MIWKPDRADGIGVDHVTVIALIGIPGAGKSRLAQALAARLRWPIVDRDRFPRPEPDAAGKAAATEAAFGAIGERLARGESCILDGMTFSSAAQRNRLRDLAWRQQARALMLWLDCPVDLALRRVRDQRDHPAQDRDEALVRDVAARFDPPEADVIRLDAQRPADELVRALSEIL